MVKLQNDSALRQTHPASRKYSQRWKNARQKKGRTFLSHRIRSRCLDTLSVSPPSMATRPLRFSEHRLPGRRQPAAGREQVSANRRSQCARPLGRGGEGGNAVLVPSLPLSLRPSPMKAAGATPACSVPPSPSISSLRPSSLVSCENARPEEPGDGGAGGGSSGRGRRRRSLARSLGSLRELLTSDRRRQRRQRDITVRNRSDQSVAHSRSKRRYVRAGR